jgi:hypothetical protein
MQHFFAPPNLTLLMQNYPIYKSEKKMVFTPFIGVKVWKGFPTINPLSKQPALHGVYGSHVGKFSLRSFK